MNNVLACIGLQLKYSSYILKCHTTLGHGESLNALVSIDGSLEMLHECSFALKAISLKEI
jgi:hypothetical protein